MRGPVIAVYTNAYGNLGKHFEVAAGKIVPSSKTSFSEGSVRILPAPDAAALWAIFAGLDQNQAAGTGRLRDGDSAAVSGGGWSGTIKRNTDNLMFLKEPGWLPVDYDTKGMPQSTRDKIDALGGIANAIYSIWPEAATGDRLFLSSSSNGVTAAGLPPLSSDGMHLYFLISDVSRSEEVLKTLRDRAWNAGLAWCMPNTPETAVLERCIIDITVGSPERLLFEARPTLGPGVARDPVPPEIHATGVVLDVPTNTPEETKAARETCAQAKAALKPVIDKGKKRFVNDKAKIIVRKTGKTLDAARDEARKMLRGRDLPLDWVLTLKDESQVTVRDVLAKPDKYHRASIPCPIEGLSYGDSNATLLIKPRKGNPNDVPCITSHAHGIKKIYTLALGRVRLPKAAELPDGHRTTLLEALTNADPEDALPVAVAAVHRLQADVPLAIMPDGIMHLIQTRLAEPLSEDEIAALKERAEYMIAKRKKVIFEQSDIKRHAIDRHIYIKISNLNEVPDQSCRGICAIKAPMGSGKTQIIGRRLVELAKAQGRSVMAIAHRISLIAELARRLGMPNYLTATLEEIVEYAALAICLPSTAHRDFMTAMPAPEYVFIDEIAQVLRFLDAKACKVSRGTNKDVFDRLVQIVRKARTVVVCDADLDLRTLKFLEHCRPTDTITVYDMAPQPHDKRAIFHDGYPSVSAEVEIEMDSGGRVYVACEGAERAEVLAAIYAARGYNTLCITARTKPRGDVLAFLADPEGQSRLYDLVVSSPAITSGISIEHAGDHHFTMGAYFGLGSQIRPEDAMQQMGRVRSLELWHVGIEKSNLGGKQSAQSRRDGLRDIAEIENRENDWSYFDDFVNRMRHDADLAKADFGASLWWMHEAAGFDVERAQGGHATSNAKEVKAMTEAQRAARAAHIVAATPLPYAEAKAVRMQRERGPDTDCRLMARDLREMLSKPTIDDADVRFFDDGRGKQMIAQFEDLIGAEIWRPKEKGGMTQRDNRHARHKMYAEILAGIDLRRPLSAANQVLILDRIMARANICATLGIVGSKYSNKYAPKTGKIIPAKRPKQIGKEVRDFLSKAGLRSGYGKRRKMSKTAIPSITDRAKWTPQQRPRELIVDPESFKYMQGIIDRRADFDVVNLCKTVDVFAGDDDLENALMHDLDAPPQETPINTSPKEAKPMLETPRCEPPALKTKLARRARKTKHEIAAQAEAIVRTLCAQNDRPTTPRRRDELMRNVRYVLNSRDARCKAWPVSETILHTWGLAADLAHSQYSTAEGGHLAPPDGFTVHYWATAYTMPDGGVMVQGLDVAVPFGDNPAPYAKTLAVRRMRDLGKTEAACRSQRR